MHPPQVWGSTKNPSKAGFFVLYNKQMKLTFEKTNDSPLNILRRAGYAFLRHDEKTGEMSFVKRVGNAGYPRFHVYVKMLGQGAEINLHLDQKKVSYEGATAHSGEYNAKENQWLEKEAETIKREFEKP